MATRLNVVAMPATGVRKPLSSMRSSRIAIDPRIQLPNVAPVVERGKLRPWMIAPAQTPSRRRMSPTPGQPSGKLENSLCSLCLLGRKARCR
jgi:hypothetical protein